MHIVYRSYTGQNLFSGILNKSAAKVKSEDKGAANQPLIKFKSKFTVVVKNGAEFKVEHCLATFLNDTDRDNFNKLYK